MAEKKLILFLILKKKINILKNIYQNFYVSVGHYLYDYLYNLPLLGKENIDEDSTLNEYPFLNFNSNYNDREIIDTYDSFTVTTVDFQETII